MRKRDLL
jgi:hypothetical protein